MDVTAVLSVIIALLSIAATVIAGVRWLVKHYFEEIKHELKPNSGTSIKDQVTRLETSVATLEQEHQRLRKGHEDTHKIVTDQDKKITKIYDTLLDYISKK